MILSRLARRLSVWAVLLSLWTVPVAATAQTQTQTKTQTQTQTVQIVPPKNKYKVEDDIKIGNEAARQIEQQYPILNDDETTRYVASVGQRLVASIPQQYQQPAFTFRFKVVNASDLNAFALPGGPMFVNRGMIEAAKNEAEMAGVMAHELSHVVLRHATAQATRQQSFGNQLGVIGMILGGAVIGGDGGAQLGAMAAEVRMTKFSREYETQADTLGAQIMANAGYDPHNLANVFKTIEATSGSGGPEFMSDHPNPAHRYENINNLAEMLKIGPAPPVFPPGLEDVQAKLRAMPKAQTMAQIEQQVQRNQGQGQGRGQGGYGQGQGGYGQGQGGYGQGQGQGGYGQGQGGYGQGQGQGGYGQGQGGYGQGQGRGQGGYGQGQRQSRNRGQSPNTNSDPMLNGRYSDTVATPSTQTRSVSSGSAVTLEVPTNWKEFPGTDQVQFAPDGAFGNQGITYGAMVGISHAGSGSLSTQAQAYVTSLTQNDPYLTQIRSSQTTIGGRNGLMTVLSGESPITGHTEIVTVYNLQMSGGDLLFVVTVVPDADSGAYAGAFRNLISSVRLNN